MTPEINARLSILVALVMTVAGCGLENRDDAVVIARKGKGDRARLVDNGSPRTQALSSIPSGKLWLEVSAPLGDSIVLEGVIATEGRIEPVGSVLPELGQPSCLIQLAPGRPLRPGTQLPVSVRKESASRLDSELANSTTDVYLIELALESSSNFLAEFHCSVRIPAVRAFQLRDLDRVLGRHFKLIVTN